MKSSSDKVATRVGLLKIPAAEVLWRRIVLMGLTFFGCGNLLSAQTNPPACLPPPAGLAGWWPGEGDTTDVVGGNAGILQGGAGFFSGKVGQAFSFAGVAAVKIPAALNLNVGTGPGFTIEAWINPVDLSTLPLFEWNSGGGSPGDVGVHFWQSISGAGTLFGQIPDLNGGAHEITSSAVLVANTYQHVALSYDKASGVAKIYRNGAVVALANVGSFTPKTGFDLYLGRRASFSPAVSFAGFIDEPALYSRALTDLEIQAIYNADSAGKCRAPAPPSILVQPQGQSVVVGRSANFSVAAAGTSPLSYQWQHNGTNLPGAAASRLALPGAQPPDAGTYSVVVTNAYGAMTSAVVNLTVIVPSCLPVPAGLVSWWPGEGDTTDVVGGSAGLLQGGAGFAPGKVGQAFSFSGSAAVKIPAASTLNVGFGSGFTLEAWINPADLSTVPLFEWNSGGGASSDVGVHFWQSQSGVGNLFGQIPDLNGGAHEITSPAVLTANSNQHVALSYDKASGQAKIYHNGVVVAQAGLGSFTPKTGFDLYLGRRVSFQPTVSFTGRIDEPAVYNRTLTEAEIKAIYDADYAGKCQTPTPPSVLTQPQDQSVVVGRGVSFLVTAIGATSLNYQWRHNGTNLPGATMPSLALPSVQVNDAGAYDVVVTNIYGAVTSSVANLSVIIPSCLPTPSGLVSWWRGEGSATDAFGGNSGTLQGGVSFGAGKVGQAFSFSASAAVKIPAAMNLNVGLGTGFTIEAWVKPSDLSALPLFEWSSGGGTSSDVGVHLWQSISGTGALFGQVADANGGAHEISSPAVLVANSNQHVALSYDKASGVAKIYHNGAVVAQAGLTSFIPKTGFDLYLGRRASFQPIISFAGLIDEPALYNRALTDVEVKAIYDADYAGKCLAPAPPSILAQPWDQTVFVGQAASFSVVAVGPDPLRYQWRRDGTNLPGATAAALAFPNAQLGDAGTYSVVVSNDFGSIVGSNATLVVKTRSCAAMLPGLVSVWQAEGDAHDLLGQNAGAIGGGASFAPGKVGQAFLFPNTESFVKISANSNLDVGSGAGFTIEAWVNPDQVSVASTLFEWNSGSGTSGVHFQINPGFGGAGALYANIVDTSGNWHQISSPGGQIPAGAFTHVALTYDKVSGTARIYRDGILVVEQYPGTFTPLTSSDLYLGRRQSGSGTYPFRGLMDEASVYNRALNSNELQGILIADFAGKCSALAPFVTRQPVGRSVIVNHPAEFAVDVGGSSPLSFQWRRNGTNLPGANAQVLALGSPQVGDDGAYSVVITNTYGSVTSAVAMLSVEVRACVAPPSGIVGWWAGEADTQDNAGANLGISQGGLAYAAGVAGQGFKFDGDKAAVRVPASVELNVGRAEGFSIEAWINPDNLLNLPLFEWSGPTGQLSDLGVHFWQSQPGFGDTGSLFANLVDANNAFHIIYSPPVLVAGSNQHVALTYDKASGQAKLYHNGIVVAQADLGSFVPRTDSDLYLGRRPSYPGIVSFAGVIDEAAVYDRVLAAAEIQGIVYADYAGKCAVPLAPAITGQPQSFTAAFQSSAGFEVKASGRGPLSYQWFLNGATIPGATNRILPFPNLVPLDEGSYFAVAANPYGAVTSSVATVRIIYPSRAIYVPGLTASPGGTVSVPVRLAASGDEHAVGFSLSFDPALLAYAGVSPGGGATNATMIAATSDAANGHIGFAPALPSDTTFAPGTQEVLRVNFNIAVLTNSQIATIAFSDQPVLRLLSDANVNLLPATFIDGGVVIPSAGFEGDVSPRPNGDRNTTIFDWLQAGRFLAGVDALGSPGEFQRLDCAPRATRGDGVLALTDWVQVGRYAGLLDPLTVAAGPTGSGSFTAFASGTGAIAATNGRTVRVEDTAMVGGQPATVPVLLVAQGDENALGFTLNYDAVLLHCTGAAAGAQATGALLIANTNQPGKLAVLLALTPGATFAAGTNEVVRIHFQVDPGAAGQIPLLLSDQLVTRAVSDAQASALSAVYSDGVAVISPGPPILRAARVGDTVIVSWPGSAAGYFLDASDDPTQSGGWSPAGTNAVLVGGEYRVVLDPVPPNRFFRLRRP